MLTQKKTVLIKWTGQRLIILWKTDFDLIQSNNLEFSFNASISHLCFTYIVCLFWWMTWAFVVITLICAD